MCYNKIQDSIDKEYEEADNFKGAEAYAIAYV